MESVRVKPIIYPTRRTPHVNQTRMHINTSEDTDSHACMYKYTNTCCTHPCINTHTNIHSYTRSNNTHKNTCISFQPQMCTHMCRTHVLPLRITFRRAMYTDGSFTVSRMKQYHVGKIATVRHAITFCHTSSPSMSEGSRYSVDELPRSNLNRQRVDTPRFMHEHTDPP